MLLSLKIIPNSILYDISRPVTDSEYGDDLKVHMDNMAETMYAHTGIGLSGVQVGDLRRILVADLGYVRTKTYGGDTVYMVNPSIVEQSDKKTKASEGCLSYPKLECALERPDWIVVNYYLPNGDNVIERFEG
jgi:peptide deformylase